MTDTMPSSNPFRRSRIGAGSIAQSASGGNDPPASNSNNSAVLDDDAAFPFPARTSTTTAPRPQKTVRIASPPVPSNSPPAAANPVSATPPDLYTTFKCQPIVHQGSPPPPEIPHDVDSADSEAEDPFLQDADASGSEGERSGDLESSIGWKNRAEQQSQSQHRRSYSSNAAAPPAPAPADASGSKRATMDVDAFKRLLMTGDAGSGLGLSTQARGHTQSRSEGAGTPYSMQTMDSFPLNHDQIRPKPANALAGPGEKKKPPPPKTRHGRLIRSNDEPQSNQPSVPTSTYSPAMHLERRPRPLPRTPSEISMTPTTTSAISADSARVSSNPPSQLKRPPTPPLARRQSQMRQDKSGVSRSNSARLTVSSNAFNADFSRRSSMPKTPPLPPSPRRRDRQIATPPSPSIYADSSHRSSSLNSPPKGTESPVDSLDNLSLYRSASGSIKGISRQPSTSNVPPRPPPPRRSGGGSNRASLDDTRPVITEPNHNPRNPRPDPAEQRQQSHAHDILADLSRLQQEVDSLRGQRGSQ